MVVHDWILAPWFLESGVRDFVVGVLPWRAFQCGGKVSFWLLMIGIGGPVEVHPWSERRSLRRLTGSTYSE